MLIKPGPLFSPHLTLEPLTEAHAAGLKAACAADTEVWPRLYRESWAPAEFAASWDKLMGANATGRALSYAVIVKDLVVGMTSFLALDAAEASLDIGATYYHPDYRGGAVNPAAKYLLLDRAFTGGARRVAFTVDALNTRSQAAVLKLGATREGLLRQDRVTWTGRIRDTVIFSILQSEWPEVQDRLNLRLSAFS